MDDSHFCILFKLKYYFIILYITNVRSYNCLFLEKSTSTDDEYFE